MGMVMVMVMVMVVMMVIRIGIRIGRRLGKRRGIKIEFLLLTTPPPTPTLQPLLISLSPFC